MPYRDTLTTAAVYAMQSIDPGSLSLGVILGTGACAAYAAFKWVKGFANSLMTLAEMIKKASQRAH